MNKLIKGMLVGSFVILTATACGGKKLTCTMKEDDTEMKYVLTYKGKKDEATITKMQMVATKTEDSTDDAKDSEKEAKETCKEYKDDKKTKCTVKRSGKKVTMTMTTSDKEQLESYNSDDGVDIEDLKDSFEKIGMKCK
jgi:hypothetical protein